MGRDGNRFRICVHVTGGIRNGCTGCRASRGAFPHNELFRGSNDDHTFCFGLWCGHILSYFDFVANFRNSYWSSLPRADERDVGAVHCP